MKFVYLLVWCWEWFGDLLLICWCCIPCCKLRFAIKMVVSSFSFEHVNCIVYETWLWYKNVSFRGSYRAPRWILYSRDVLCAAKVTIIEGRVVRRDRCMDRYVPHGSRAERQRVCIVREDMHHYIWHCISWHCTFYYWWTWTCVLLILWVFFCEACDCWILSCYWECVNW